MAVIYRMKNVVPRQCIDVFEPTAEDDSEGVDSGLHQVAGHVQAAVVAVQEVRADEVDTALVAEQLRTETWSPVNTL